MCVFLATHELLGTGECWSAPPTNLQAAQKGLPFHYKITSNNKKFTVLLNTTLNVTKTVHINKTELVPPPSEALIVSIKSEENQAIELVKTV